MLAQSCQQLASLRFLLPAGTHSHAECVKLVGKCPLQIYQLQYNYFCSRHRTAPAADTPALHSSRSAFLQRATQQELIPSVKTSNPTASQLPGGMTSEVAKLALSNLGTEVLPVCPLHAQPNSYSNFFYSLTGDALSQDTRSAKQALKHRLRRTHLKGWHALDLSLSLLIPFEFHSSSGSL